MLIPKFVLSQDDDFVFVKIAAPLANIKDTIVEYFYKSFYFASPPYFLELSFSFEVIDNEISGIDYRSDGGIFTINVPKKNKGEYFKDLHMLSEIVEVSKEPKINLISDIEINKDPDTSSCSVFPKCSNIDDDIMEFGYGFAWNQHNLLHPFGNLIKDLIELADPDNISIKDRPGICLLNDQKAFQREYYLADLHEKTDEFSDIMNFTLPEPFPELTFIKQKEIEIRSRCLTLKVSPECNSALFLSLIDMLYAFLYDYRTTLGEHNIGSGLTIVKLSPTLSCLVKWSDLSDVIRSCIRRSLCYPLYRNWDLSLKVLNDVKTILRRGNPHVIFCFLQMRKIFKDCLEFYHVLDDLYMKRFSYWIHSISNENLAEIANNIDAIVVKKADMLLDLPELELEAEFFKLELDNKVCNELDSDDDPDSF